MSTCTYRYKDASSKEVVITGQAEMKAFLADGGIEQLLPGKVLPWRGRQGDAEKYSGPRDVSSREGQMELANRAGTIAALKAMNAQLRAIAPDEAWADANIEQAADLDALRNQISEALVKASRGEQQDSPLRKRLEAASGQDLKAVFDAIGLAGSRMTHDERVKALMAENPQEVLDALDSVEAGPATTAEPEPAKAGASLEGPRREPTKVSMFNPYQDGDVVTIGGQDWQVKQDMPGWYLTSTGNWRGTHPKIQRIRGMADLIREVEQAYQEAVPAPEQPAPQPAKAEEKSARQKAVIEDFGAKLDGARKDMQASMSKEWADDEIASQPFSKVWPATDIDAIQDPFEAAVMFAAREEVPAKPRVSYKLKAWVAKVKMFRELVSRVIGDVGRDRYLEKMKEYGGLLDGFRSKVVLLEALDRSQWKRIGQVAEYPNAYVLNDGKKVPAPQSVVEIDGKRERFDGSGSVLDALDKINEKLGVAAEPKKMQFEVRGREGFYGINKKGDKEYRKLKTFATSKEAFAYIKENYDDLVAAWDGVKDRDNVGKADVRNDTNRPRTGSDWRQGKDVTPEQFSDAFGFRGVQFGIWVSQGAGGKDRQGMLNQAYDALMDLADIVGVPPKALSLNGSLGLAFGARGSGNASAHYEPSNLVINLTKTKGAGTLAHEWFHALDNYFSRQRGGEVKIGSGVGAQEAYRTQNYITYRPEPMYVHKTQRSTPITKAQLERYHERSPQSGYYDPQNWQIDPTHPQGVRPEVERAFADLVEALDNSPMKVRAAKNDKGADGYWSRIIERGARAFENYVIHKMRLKGYDNDYLANVRKVEDFPRDAGRYPYLLDEEVEPIAEAFDNLFAEVKTKETEQGVAMFRTDYPNTQAFREWFGSSKMTNNAGEPLLFMHGSPASFEAFDTDKLGTSSSHTSSGLGHFFTRDKATAEKYADGGNIYTGWLKIEKPYVMMIEEAQAFDDAQDSAKRRKELQKMGYDGVVILDDDGKPWATVAFEPWQFKSADNNGAFDEFDDRMRFRNEDQAMRDTSTMRYTGDVPRKDAEDFIRKFVAEYPGAPSIMLADSFDQLPESIRKDAIAQGSGPTRAKGALKSDTAYVVLNNHHSMADLEATIFHEVLGHSGVRKMFGPEFSQELNRLFVGLGGYSGLQKIMEQRGLALQFHGYFDAIHQAKERNPRAWTDALAQSILTEEVFAHIAEQKNGKKLRDRFMALVGMVRDWLRRYGFASLADLGESDIVFLLQKAREGLREGEGVLREGTHVGEREIVDADGRPVARESSPDYEAIKTISGRLGLREREAPTVFQTAWHGSPHKFDKFSLDAIGTGEGAQAYGWGLYFAGKKDVAEYYRTTLSAKGMSIDGVSFEPSNYGLTELVGKYVTGQDDWAGLQNLQRALGAYIRQYADNPFAGVDDAQKMADAIGRKAFRVDHPRGALYQVEIPNDGEYLLWDKPLSEQPIAVREMLVPVLERWYGKGNADYVMTNPKSPVKDGKDLVIALGYNMQASKILLDAGIAGIKYLDGTSRNSGEGNYNYVVFDDSRVDTVSVLRTEFSAPEFRQKARDAVANLTDGLRGETARSFNWWDRTIGTQNGKAKKDADFGQVYRHAHAFLDGVSDFANRAADKARGILPHLDSWRDIGSGLNVRKQWGDSKDYQAISKAIFDGTLVNGTSGKVWSDEELKEKYGLNEKQIGFYREFRAAVDFSLETLAASEMSRLARASKLEVADRDMGMDDAKDFYVKQVDARIKEARSAIDSKAGAVVARHMEERAAIEDAFDDFASEESKEIVRKEMERRHKAEIDEVMKAVNDLEALRDSFIDKADKIHELQEQGYAPLMRFGEYTVDVVRLDKDGKPVMDEDGNPDRPFFGMFESEAEARKAEKVLAEEYPDYTVTRGVLSVEASQMYRGLTPETAELFARMLGTDTDDAFQAYLKQAVANRSAMKRLIHRMGMEGFSNDVPRVLASFLTSNARLSSGNWHFGEMSKAVEAIPKHKGDVKDEAIRMMQYVQNPQEEAAGLRGFLFFNFLGGSIASALVNLTQTFTTTLPYLNQFGPASVAKALPKAMTLAGKMMTKRGLDSVEDKGLREALQRAQDEGVVDPQEIHLLMAESQGNGASSSVSSLLGMVNKEWATPAARVTRAATQAWGSLFGAAEKYNRHVAFIAAWEVAPEGVDRYEFAKNAVTETQFDYTKASRPNWGRGAIGATLFTFKTFTISYIEFLSRLPSRERALAIAVLFLFAGMSGMPGADDLDDVIDTIGQKMGYNWNNAGSRHAWIVKTLGHDGANFVEHGISSMLPLDMSSRLSVANIAPGTAAFKKSNQSPAKDVQEFFGPAGSMVAAGRDVFDAAGSGKGAVDVALPILPKMFRDLRQAVDMWETGSYNDMKGRKVVDVSKVDALIKGIGFQPNTVAEPRRVERMLAQSSGMQRAIRDDIHELMARGRVEGDAEKQEAARELMRSWNEKNPDAPIRLNPASLAQRTRAMRLTSADRLVKATPKEMRGAIAAELETQR